jgi:hypothetical protein
MLAADLAFHDAAALDETSSHGSSPLFLYYTRRGAVAPTASNLPGRGGVSRSRV